MNCCEVLARGYDYFEKKLSPAEVAEIDAHVAGCASCGEIWIKARETNCREFAELCGEFAEGTLAPEMRRILERHLTICKPCIDYLETYRRTVELCEASGRAADEREVGVLEESLVRRILEARRKSS